MEGTEVVLPIPLDKEAFYFHCHSKPFATRRAVKYTPIHSHFDDIANRKRKSPDTLDISVHHNQRKRHY